MRITEKDGEFYKLKPEQEVYGWENGIRLVQIVGKLEDLEEELGCPLEVVFKALKGGFYTVSNSRLQLFKECDNRTVFIRHLGYDIEICCEQSKNEIHSRCEIYLERSTKDYKKTWWLKETKEE